MLALSWLVLLTRLGIAEVSLSQSSIGKVFILRSLRSWHLEASARKWIALGIFPTGQPMLDLAPLLEKLSKPMPEQTTLMAWV
jgi:hypothetical protein